MSVDVKEIAGRLAELADRCEQPISGGPELNALIAATTIADIAATRFKTVDAWAEAAVREKWNFPRFTNSIDAALRLFEDDWGYEARSSSDRCGTVNYVTIWWVPAFPGRTYGSAVTMPRAFVAAALRARAAHLLATEPTA